MTEHLQLPQKESKTTTYKQLFLELFLQILTLHDKCQNFFSN